MSLTEDINTTLGAAEMIDTLRRIVAAADDGSLRLNSKTVTYESSGALVLEYKMCTTEGRESILAEIKITGFPPKVVDMQRPARQP